MLQQQQHCFIFMSLIIIRHPCPRWFASIPGQVVPSHFPQRHVQERLPCRLTLPRLLVVVAFGRVLVARPEMPVGRVVPLLERGPPNWYQWCLGGHCFRDHYSEPPIHVLIDPW